MSVTAIDVLYEVMRSYQRTPMTNIHRSDYVEALVSLALGDSGWSRMAPWDSWDFEHTPSGTRLEVKQAADVQAWESDGRSSPPRFNIAPLTGYWAAAENRWMDEPGRHAHIYVFAWHGEPGEKEDQRDPAAWVFHVVAERDLPDQKSIGLNVLRRMAPACSMTELGAVVDTIRSDL